jgi:hypothetical protein
MMPLRILMAVWALLLSGIVCLGQVSPLHMPVIGPLLSTRALTVFSIGNTTNQQSLVDGSTMTISLSAGSDLAVPTVTTALTSAGAAITVTSVTSSHLIFARRAQTSFHDINHGNGSPWVGAEVWWAYSVGALTSEVITIHLSGAPSQGAVALATEWKGVFNPSSPWDVNVSLPVQASGDVSVAQVTGLSTTNTSPVGMLFSFSGDLAAQPTSPGTWTQDNAGEATGTTTPRLFMYHQLFSSAQSNATWSSTGTSQNWIFIGDAVGR